MLGALEQRPAFYIRKLYVDISVKRRQTRVVFSFAPPMPTSHLHAPKQVSHELTILITTRPIL